MEIKRTKTCLVLALMLFSATSLANVFELKPNTWELLVIPGDPTGQTIQTLLADDMGSLIYGWQWTMYVFDEPAQAYKSPALDDELDVGQAFWIVQTGTSAVELDIPANLPEASLVIDPTCGSDQGCYTLPLGLPRADGNVEPSTTFHLLGVPFSYSADVSDFRFVTEASGVACENGCSLDQAKSAGYAENLFWVYNSNTSRYVQVGAGDTLLPWQGFWMTTLPSAQAHFPVLNIPFSAPVSTTEKMCDVGVTTADNVIIPFLDKPAYLEPYTDPQLGGNVTRVTQSSFGQVRKPSYSTMQAWNADESLMLLYRTGENGGYHILLDGQNYEPIADLRINPVDLEEVFWSHSDPDTLFYISRGGSDAGDFNRYSVSRAQASKITDFDDICVSSPTGGADVHMQSIDDDLFGFRCRGADGRYRMLSYRISTNETRSTLIGDGTRWSEDSAPMPGPSGERFMYQGVVLGTDLSAIEQELDLGSFSEHSSVGLTYNGQDALFQTVFNASPDGCDGDADNGIGHLVEQNLETGSCRAFFTQSQGYPYTTSSTHVSAQAYKQPGWVAMSSIGRPDQFKFFSNNEAAPALLSEIYLANTDPNDPVTCRLAHHRSYGKGASNGDYAPYFGEPHATISPSGTRILFGSDWYDSGAVDSYVVELPGFVRRP